MTENAQPDWAANRGLSEETTCVFVYPAIDDKEQWKEEAEANGFSSLSKYVYAFVQEARAYQQREIGGPQHAEKRIEGLEAEVERLEQQFLVCP